MNKTLGEYWKDYLGKLLHITIVEVESFSKNNIQLTCLIHETQEYIKFDLFSKEERE